MTLTTTKIKEVRVGQLRARRQPVSASPAGETQGSGLEFLEGLLAELGDEIIAEPRVDGPITSDPDTRPTNFAQHIPAHGDFPDIWTMRGGKAPLLSATQEIALAQRVERGDQHAREELLEANIRLVASVARRYQNRGLPLEDLMQEGIIGLIRAIEKYNYRKGYRFSTYATHWIRQAVSRALANQGRSIRLPAHVVDSLVRIGRIREELLHKSGRTPTRSELAEAAGLTEKKLIQLLRNAAQPVSLESPVGAEGDSSIGDFMTASPEHSPAETAMRGLVSETLECALNTLTPREKEVITLRFGLANEDPHTLEQAGKRMSITRERARQIEFKAMEKLRHASVSGQLLEVIS